MVYTTPIIIWHKNLVLFGGCDGDGDGDGACSVANIPPPPHLSTTHWQTAPYTYHVPLSPEHGVWFHPRSPVGAVVLHRRVETVLAGYRTPAPLRDDTAQTLAQVGLLHPCPAPPAVALPGSPTILTAWLHVTNDCNLHCSYCYVDQTREAMSETTGRAALEGIFRTAGQQDFQTVKLKYAGGEATLKFELVKRLHHYAHQLAAQTGLTVQQTLLSNGVALTSRMVDFLRQHHFSLMISLDGLCEGHDQQRPFINGRGSAEQVKQGIARAIAGGVSPHLSITITQYNVATLAETVAYALDQGVSFSFNFYRQHQPGQTQASLQAEDDYLIAGVLAAFKVIEARLPRRSFLHSLVDRANFSGAHQHTCGVGHNYLVIDHHGQIAPCHMELERPITDIYADDLLIPLQTTNYGFANIPVDDKEGCQSCEWRYFCTGGCPLLTYRVTGRSDLKSPYCRVYKALYPELLRLEGLRLLKWYANQEKQT